MNETADESLEDFAEKWTSTGGHCAVCNLPERDDIDRARRDKDIKQSAVKAWLIARKGYTKEHVSRISNSIDTHFRRGHHERKK